MEVEVAVREIHTSYCEMQTRYQAMAALQAEEDYLYQRWQVLPGEDRSASFLLEDLLSVQERLAAEEFAYAKVQGHYTLALVELKRVTGTLLQCEQIATRQIHEGGVPRVVFERTASAPRSNTSEGRFAMNRLADLAPLNSVFRWFRSRAESPSPQDHDAVLQIKRLAENFERLDEPAMRHQVELLRQAVRGGRDPASSHLVVPGYALFVEAARRVLGASLFDVQLLAGLALSRRAIAEMQTGEGKTLAAALPALMHALSGRGVHVLTVNSYLAQRDYELLLPVFQLLGLSVGLLRAQATPAEKRAAYACDITYGPGYEFCFDYLRDQAALRGRSQKRLGESYRGASRGQAADEASPVQRGLAFAVIDEADSVLIDEATGPLLLSEAFVAPAANAQVFLLAKSVAAQLQTDCDYTVDRPASTVHSHRAASASSAPRPRRQHGMAYSVRGPPM